MFRMRISLNQDLMNRLRSLPERAAARFQEKVETVLRPELQRDTTSLMEDPPGPPSSPFAFGTEKSRAYWFHLIHENPGLTDGEHYRRTGEIAQQFTVRVNVSLKKDHITIRNTHPKATYVYGPWQVAGHRNTGYLDQAKIARQLLREQAIRRALEFYRESVSETLKGGG